MGNHQHKLVPYSYIRSDNYCNWVMIYEALLDMAALLLTMFRVPPVYMCSC